MQFFLKSCALFNQKICIATTSATDLSFVGHHNSLGNAQTGEHLCIKESELEKKYTYSSRKVFLILNIFIQFF